MRDSKQFPEKQDRTPKRRVGHLRPRSAKERPFDPSVARQKPVGSCVPNRIATSCEKCEAEMPPGIGVAVLLRRGSWIDTRMPMMRWVPFCPDCNAARLGDGTPRPEPTICPPMVAHLVGESSPGWRHEVERRQDFFINKHPLGKSPAAVEVLKKQQRELRAMLKP